MIKLLCGFDTTYFEGELASYRCHVCCLKRRELRGFEREIYAASLLLLPPLLSVDDG